MLFSVLGIFSINTKTTKGFNIKMSTSLIIMASFVLMMLFIPTISSEGERTLEDLIYDFNKACEDLYNLYQETGYAILHDEMINIEMNASLEFRELNDEEINRISDIRQSLEIIFEENKEEIIRLQTIPIEAFKEVERLGLVDEFWEAVG
jgi:hypothetical protein